MWMKTSCDSAHSGYLFCFNRGCRSASTIVALAAGVRFRLPPCSSRSCHGSNRTRGIQCDKHAMRRS